MLTPLRAGVNHLRRIGPRPGGADMAGPKAPEEVVIAAEVVSR
jgi:hypothetical protein